MVVTLGKSIDVVNYHTLLDRVMPLDAGHLWQIVEMPDIEDEKKLYEERQQDMQPIDILTSFRYKLVTIY